jgi:AbrB family looped-hinge helix DNA binding protein
METVVVSPTFQVRLPKAVREALGLEPGQRLRVVHYDRRIELVPLRPAFECPTLFGPPCDREGPGAEPLDATVGG